MATSPPAGALRTSRRSCPRCWTPSPWGSRRDDRGPGSWVRPLAERPAGPGHGSDSVVPAAQDRRRGRDRPGCAGGPGSPALPAGADVRTDVQAWFARRTSAMADWDRRRARAGQGTTTVSVVLPARNEGGPSATSSGGCAVSWSRRCRWSTRSSSSTPAPSDGTGDGGAGAGARRCYRQGDVPPRARRPAGQGRGAVEVAARDHGRRRRLRRRRPARLRPRVRRGAARPAADRPAAPHFVKAFYDRPLDDGRTRAARPAAGG